MKLTKSRITNIALFLFSIGITLFLGEFITRWIAPQQLILIDDSVWQPDSVYGTSLKPLVNTFINTGEKTVHFVTDNNGYRISNISNLNVKNDNQLRVLTLGDSFLEAAQVENESTMNEQLKGMLEQEGIHVQFVNTGVGGWGPNQYLLKARRELNRNKYDLGIVYLFLGNDIVSEFDTLIEARQSNVKKFKLSELHTWKGWKDNVFYPINNFLEQTSHLYVLAKNSNNKLLVKLGLSAVHFPQSFTVSEKTLISLDVTTEILTAISNEFESNSTPVIFVLLPQLIQVYPEEFEKYKQMFNVDHLSIDITLPNRILLEKSKTYHFLLFDPIEKMKVDAKSGVRLYGKIDFHFNENGHRAVAEYLFPHILDILEQHTCSK